MLPRTAEQESLASIQKEAGSWRKERKGQILEAGTNERKRLCLITGLSYPIKTACSSIPGSESGLGKMT